VRRIQTTAQIRYNDHGQPDRHAHDLTVGEFFNDGLGRPQLRTGEADYEDDDW